MFNLRLLRRRPGGLSTLFILLGIFGCITAATLSVIGAPLAWWRAREVAEYPQPQPSELEMIPPGTPVLLAARLPTDVETIRHGLALYKVEVLVETHDETGTAAGWRLAMPPPARVRLALVDGHEITVQMPEDVAFANAQTFESEDRKERTIGYLPGQALTVDGAWEGANMITAASLYAGTPEAYVDYRRRQPGMSLLGAGFCGSASLGLFVIAAVLRVRGQ